MADFTLRPDTLSTARGSRRDSGLPSSRRSAASVTTRTTTRRVPAGVSPSRLVHPSEGDEYIASLKGQIYLLSLENELIKKSDGTLASNSFLGGTNNVSGDSTQRSSGAWGSSTGSASSGHGGNGAASRSGDAYSQYYQQQNPQGPAPTLRVSGATAADGTAPLEAMLRGTFQAQASGFESELAERKRAEAALAAQCASQSGLLAALRAELDATHEALAEQKSATQAAQHTAAAEGESKRAESRRLTQTVKRLERDSIALRQEVEARDHALAEARAAIAAAEAARAAADAVLANAIEEHASLGSRDASHASVVATLKAKIEDGDAELARVKHDREVAAARGDAAEQDSLVARAAAAAAATARDEALATSRELRARIGTLEEDARRLESERSARRLATDGIERKLGAALKRAETAEAAVASAAKERDAALERTVGAERRLAAALTDGERARRVAAEAEGRASDAETRSTELADELAAARGRIASLEGALDDATRRLTARDAELQEERENHIAAASEADALRKELAHRPPVDVLAALEVQSLLQRNSEAAAAVAALLEKSRRGTADGGGAPSRRASLASTRAAIAAATAATTAAAATGVHSPS